MQKFRNLSLADKIFYTLVTLLLTAVFIMVLYPCIFVISASFSSGDAVMAGKVVLFPVDFSLEGYKTVFKTAGVWTGFRNSLFYTVTHTLLSVALTITAAYCLSRKDVPGGKFVMLMFTFTMFFSGGMIPNYMLMRELGFLNTIWAVIIPGSITAYNLIVARTFIRNSIPEEMMEAAMLDGCSDFRYFTDIVAPLCHRGTWAEWMSVLINLVRTYREIPYIDKTRIHLTGNSMGGYGTWALASLRPHWFASAMPICGGGLGGLAMNLMHLPIRAFHGLRDKIVDPIESLQMAKAVNQYGGHAELILFPELEHNCWDAVFSDEKNYDWLLAFTAQPDNYPVEDLSTTYF